MKVLVTSALPYVNNVPHLGNLVCIISADVYSRYLKLKRIENIFVLGTDEHGTTTETRAALEGKTPKEICDKYSKIHKEIYDWFEVKPDCWGRSSSEANKEITQEIFLKLDENGYIIEKEIEQAYCNKCKRFLSDRYILGTCPYCKYENARGDQCEKCGKLLEPKELINPRCAICGSTPIFKKSRHLFIDLPALADELEKWIEKNKNKWSENARTMTEAWLKNGLEPRCITRDLKWGIKVPLKGYENKVFYSWFDAPIAYISITKENRDDWKEWWKNPKEVSLVQFMGKDNIPFHTILFPASLIGTKEKWTLLDKMSVNEYLNYESGMFSKSRHIGVFGDDAIKTGIKADVFRYYLMINRPEKTDTEFSWQDFKDKNNHELVANFGNLVNRTLSFIHRFFNGVVPESDVKSNSFIREWHEALKKIDKFYAELELKKALRAVMELSKKGNKFFQDAEPWKSLKEQKTKDALFILVNLVKDLAVLISPFMPDAAESIRHKLGLKELKWDDLGNLSIKPGKKILQGSLLFRKITEDEIKKLQDKFSGEKKETPFNKLDLRVAEIIEAKQHENADKLYVLKLNLGNSKRQIVSGIKEWYTLEELPGKKIVIVANLEPANLRGEISNGMLLAAMKGNDMKILEAPNSKPGARVFVEGSKQGKKKIKIKEFKEVKFVVKNRNIYVDAHPLKTDTEVIKVDMPDGSKIS